jgi:DNA-binding IclR family transcriptional regulator
MNRRQARDKAKAAQRLIELLEFFDERLRPATVTDICGHFKWPQSSTSELLVALVEMGLLYKDDRSRSFAPTPRAAMLGTGCQPRLVRDGRLSMLAEDLREQSGFSVALMGQVGLDVQIFGWTAAPTPASPAGLAGGMRAPLDENVAGWLLLSAMPAQQRDGLLRRLRAEAPGERRFRPAMITERIQTCALKGAGVGPAGFGSRAEMCAVLLDAEPAKRPMVLGLVYEPAQCPHLAPLIALLKRSAQALSGDASDRVADLNEHRPAPHPGSSPRPGGALLAHPAPAAATPPRTRIR